MEGLKFHHIGYATKNLESSKNDFEKLGYENTGNFVDEVQNINISIMEQEGHPIIELIEPNGKDNPIERFLVDQRTTTYHTAFLTKTFSKHIKELRNSGFTPTTNVLKSVAFKNRNFIFLYSVNVGLIELLDETLQ